MAENLNTTVTVNESSDPQNNGSQDRTALNRQLAQMLKGGVIMDVTTPEQARIAEDSGACAVMALERIPADIRAAGGVSRMSDPAMIHGIQEAVSIPVMQNAVLVTLLKRRCLRLLRSITLTKAKCLAQQTTFTTLTSAILQFHLFAVQKIWEKLCAGLTRVLP